MKVYIQANEQGLPDNINCYNAYLGFSKLLADIQLFQGESEIAEFFPEDIIVSHVGIIRNRLESLGFTYPELCYPPALNGFLGRNTEKTVLQTIVKHPEKWPIFIKPVVGKRFQGTVVKTALDLIDTVHLPYDTEVYCSEVLDIVSEWRAFVRYGKILDVRHYKGNWQKVYDYRVIEECVAQYADAPSGYGIDFAVTHDGKTILLEVNDGYSLGCYGLFPAEYAKLLSARWAELTHTEDQFNF